MENVCTIASGSMHDAEYWLAFTDWNTWQWIPVVLKRNGTVVMCSEIIKFGSWKEAAEFAQ
jgi:hypothetical protein